MCTPGASSKGQQLEPNFWGGDWDITPKYLKINFKRSWIGIPRIRCTRIFFSLHLKGKMWEIKRKNWQMHHKFLLARYILQSYITHIHIHTHRPTCYCCVSYPTKGHMHKEREREHLCWTYPICMPYLIHMWFSLFMLPFRYFGHKTMRKAILCLDCTPALICDD